MDVTAMLISSVSATAAVLWWNRSRMNRCPRCRRGNLSKANFCRACGLMLKSHEQVELWLSRQRRMLKEREELLRGLEPIELASGKVIEVAAGEAITQGKFVYLDPITEKLYAAPR